MDATHTALDSADPFNLRRFIDAQDRHFAHVLKELHAGQKRTHWMRYIFPQIDGLGSSPNAKQYALKSIAEAQHYLQHPELRRRLRACVQVLLDLKGRSAREIFDWPDDLKLRSSMTLFAQAQPNEPAFARVLDIYFQGQPDPKTLALLNQQSTQV